MDFHVWEEPLNLKVSLGKVCKKCGIDQECSTYDCPGRKMTDEEIEEVRSGNKDYKDGRWRIFVKLYN